MQTERENERQWGGEQYVQIVVVAYRVAVIQARRKRGLLEAE